MKLTTVLLEVRSRFPGFSGHYSEGVASIAAAAKAAGHDFELIHLTRPLPPGKFAARLAASRPDVVGFSCMTHTFPYLKSYVQSVSSVVPRIPVVVGGVHAMLDPEGVLAVEGIDAVCLGEGETTMVSLLNRVQRTRGIQDLQGLWVREGPRIHRNPVAPLVENLDSLPIPDRGVFEFSKLVSTREGVLYVFASRGCPYRCRFCCNEAIRARYPNRGRYVRHKSVPRLCQEIEAAVDLFPGELRGIYFQDEILGLDKAWLAEFTAQYRRRFGIPFNCNLRADLVTAELAQRLHAAGCRSVSIGLESGSERIRGAVLGKKISDRQYREAFDLLARAGLKINTFSMLGLPGETCETALDTIRMNAAPQINKSMVSIFFPYPGTPLRDECLADGILTERIPDTYQETTALHQTTISRVQVEFLHDFFGALVALSRRRLGDRVLRTVLASFVRRGGASLRLLSLLTRALRRVLIPLYLGLGSQLLSRQSKIFGD
jgi:radical SAM superfamily enzyme YgiQ (UPF0313 family)